MGEAYRHEEAFYGVYDGTGTRDHALARYAAWRRSATPEVRDAFADLIRAFTQLAAADSPLLRSSQMTKPKFRRREAEPTVGYAMFEMVGGASFGQNQHEQVEAAKNYGADISTLTRLIEDGKL